MKIFGREPAAWVALITILVQAIGAFWVGFDVDTQAWVVAAVAAGLNLVVAFVTHDGVIAAISGFVQAAIVLTVGLGAHLNTHQQFYILAAVVAVAQWITRQNVTAPVPASMFRQLTYPSRPVLAPQPVPDQPKA